MSYDDSFEWPDIQIEATFRSGRCEATVSALRETDADGRHVVTRSVSLGFDDDGRNPSYIDGGFYTEELPDALLVLAQATQYVHSMNTREQEPTSARVILAVG